MTLSASIRDRFGNLQSIDIDSLTKPNDAFSLSYFCDSEQEKATAVAELTALKTQLKWEGELKESTVSDKKSNNFGKPVVTLLQFAPKPKRTVSDFRTKFGL